MAVELAEDAELFEIERVHALSESPVLLASLVVELHTIQQKILADLEELRVLQCKNNTEL